jgi:hypothetical protein
MALAQRALRGGLAGLRVSIIMLALEHLIDRMET